MKHTSIVTLILVGIFLLSQVTGLWIVDKYINHPSSERAGEVVWNDLPYNFERPPVQNKTSSFVPQEVALALAVFVSVWKMFRPNIFIHNISELFIYGGLAAIFVPMLNIYAAVLL